MIYSSELALNQESLSGFEVRSGFPDDIEAMALLTERADADRAGRPLPIVIPEGSEDYADLLERQHYAGFWSHLVFDGDRLAGFTAGYPGSWKGEDDGSNSDYLWLLMIDPDYQRKGIGRSLLRLAGASAYETGASSLVLFTATDNHRAISLYESEGYRRTGVVISDRQGELAKYTLGICED